jgi:carboxyl-terminal processing protease
MSAEAPLDGLIIDNRFNSGGASNVMLDVLSNFTDGTVGYFVNRSGEEPLTVSRVDINGTQSMPLVVLVGPDTVSFGEVFSGILRDLGRATLIGQATEGNVEILYIYNFSDGSRAWIAHDTFRPLNQTDQNWEETGVIPDINAYSSWDLVSTETDPVINAALRELSNP